MTKKIQLKRILTSLMVIALAFIHEGCKHLLHRRLEMISVMDCGLKPM